MYCFVITNLGRWRKGLVLSRLPSQLFPGNLKAKLSGIISMKGVLWNLRAGMYGGPRKTGTRN